MKRAYSPFDVAVYFKTENLPVSEEHRILESLWEYRDALLVARYRKGKRLFSNSVRNALHKLDGINEGVDEANIILAEMGSKYQVFEVEFEQDVMESYFKVMKLRLTYSPGKDYCRLKLRTLIRCFGYK